MMRERRKHGFTLVELLVVITIIGVLIALLLPAVQAAREAARQAQCNNHVKQLALGVLSHEEANKILPTGGWGLYWTGDPDRGFGRKQPGGWIFSILPYIEQGPLHDLGSGTTDSTNPKRIDCVFQQMATPVATLICPSRRSAITYPMPAIYCYYACGAKSGGLPALVGKTDYCANGGTSNESDSIAGQSFWGAFGWGPPNYADADTMSNSDWVNDTSGLIYHAKDTGVVFTHSALAMAEIEDGASNTYLVGEKYMNPDYYLTGEDTGDNQHWDIGPDWDVLRYTGTTADAPGTNTFLGRMEYFFLPRQDTPGYDMGFMFGSAHPVGFNISFCDGSARSVSYSIDPVVHWRLGNRMDGCAIDAKKL